jgi:hypothetical protein
MPKRKNKATDNFCEELVGAEKERTELINAIQKLVPSAFVYLLPPFPETLKTDFRTTLYKFKRVNNETNESMTGSLLSVPAGSGLYIMVAYVDTVDGDRCENKELILAYYYTSIHLIVRHFLDELMAGDDCNRLVFSIEANLATLWVYFKGVLEEYDRKLLKFAATLNSKFTF